MKVLFRVVLALGSFAAGAHGAAVHLVQEPPAQITSAAPSVFLVDSDVSLFAISGSSRPPTRPERSRCISVRLGRE